MNHFSQNCDVTVFYMILEFHEFYRFYILGKGKVTQGYLRFMTFFMKKLKNPKKLDNILHFQTSATQTSIESTVGPLLLRTFGYWKTDTIKNVDTICHFQIE